MDPLTTAILTAVAAKTAEQAVVESYKALKNLLKQKYGTKSKIVEAVVALESNPDSGARKDVVQEEIVATKADKDTELLKAAQTLLDSLNVKQDIGDRNQTAVGNQNIQIIGDHNSASTNSPRSNNK